ncbi:MAG TPA: CARDB domain-containing protein [Candidatus Nanoarchaeia archaeon]|nr:CARDB domain-containing protein [Candidatus Nanoarchaeia archaeon]
MNQTFKWIPTLFLVIISLTSVSALTIDELIDQTNFDYFRGDINATSFSDSMFDSNSNGQNDILNITLNFNMTVSNNYNVFVDLGESYGVITNNDSKSLGLGTGSMSITFDSKLFNQDQHNYTVRIYDNNSLLVYRKDNVETSSYSNYERGVNITAITDENINNDFIRINLTLNVTESQTTNVTVFLQYNHSYISASEQETLTAGFQTVSIDFDDETIKSTHYNNNLTVDVVTIGDKTTDTNHSTSVYNYEDFAKTSYMKNFSTGKIDTNQNNLSEFYQVNVTLEIKAYATYEVKGEIYDLFDTYIANFSTTDAYTTGTQLVQINVNGTEFYSSYANGPYMINSIELLNSSGWLVDYIFQPHTDQNASYYTDYERPPLPDLTISMDTVFTSSANVTDLMLTVSNIGEAPAFGVFTDVFDNNTYANNRTQSYLNISESVVYNFSISNSASDTIYTAIVDLGNYVDESDETNNILTGQRALSMTTLQLLSSTASLATFEAVILNNGTIGINNITWYMNFGDGNITKNNYNFDLSANEDIFIFAEHNYSSPGIYTVTVNASADSVSDSISDVFNIGNVTDVNKFTIKNTSGSSIAWFGDSGNAVIKGALEQNSAHARSADFAFVIRNNGEDVLIIENDGNVYIDGTLSENQSTISSSLDDTDFRIRKDGEWQIVVNESGHVFLKGMLTQNGNP